MIGVDLQKNYTQNPEAHLRKKWSCATSSSATLPTVESVTPAPSTTPVMVKTLHDYFIPIVASMPVGLAVNTRNGNFELRTGLIMMVQTNQFSGLPSEDANTHLQHFLELCDTIIIKDVAPESIRLRLFPFPSWGRRSVVLQGNGSCQDVGQMFHDVPRQVLPHGQNQCSKGINLQLLTECHRIHSRGVGKVAGLHPSMTAPRDRKLVSASIFL